MKKTKVEKLADKMRAIGHPVRLESFMRTHAGCHQKASGGWLWAMEGESGKEYGSTYSVTDLLKAPRISVLKIHRHINDYEVFPE